MFASGELALRGVGLELEEAVAEEGVILSLKLINGDFLRCVWICVLKELEESARDNRESMVGYVVVCEISVGCCQAEKERRVYKKHD